MPFFVPKITLNMAKTMFGVPKIERNPLNFPEPEIIVEDFLARKTEIENQNAREFLDLLLENIETDKYGFNNTETAVNQQSDDFPALTPQDIAEGLEVDGDNVIVSDEKGIGGISFLELATMLEYGRKDKGIPPRDIFRKTFKEFKETAIKNILNF